MRLITCLAPLPDEDLRSLLGRLGRENEYVEDGWYRTWDCIYGLHSNVMLLRSADYYDALSALVDLSVEDLRYLTLHRFVPSFYSAGEIAVLGLGKDPADLGYPMWEAKRIERYLRIQGGVNGQLVCPLCWASRQGGRLQWSIWHVTTCPIHRVLLLDRCTTCGHKLRVNYATGRCHKCGTAIESLHAQPLDTDEAGLALTSLVWNALEYDVHDPGDLIGPGRSGPCLNPLFKDLAHPLAQMDSHALLRFFWRFSHILAIRDPENPIFLQPSLTAPAIYPASWHAATLPPIGEIHRVLTGVCRLLLDWPGSWHETLGRLAALEESRVDGMRWVQPLPQILFREFGKPEWAWLQDSWEMYVYNNMRNNPALQPWLYYYRKLKAARGELAEMLSPKQMANQVGAKVETVKRLIQQGVVETTSHIPTFHDDLKNVPTGSTRSKRPYRIIIVPTSAVARFSKFRASHMSLIKTSEYLGISETHARALVRRDLLPVSPSLNASRYWISKDNVHEFLRRVLEPCTTKGRPGASHAQTTVTLVDAVFVGAGQGLGLVKLLSALATGTVQGYRSGKTQALSDIWFYRQDVQQYLLDSTATAPGQSLIMRSEALRLLECNDNTLQRWREVGLITPVVDDSERSKAIRLYDRRHIETFRERYITSVEAAAILGCTNSTLRELAWASNIPASCIAYTPDPAYGYWLFDREALQCWVADRILCDEAADLLGVHPETVKKWARVGRLSRVSNIWFSRREILTWRDDMVPTKVAAELLGVSLLTMIKWVKVGNFEPVAVVGKNNKWWYFSREYLTEWRLGRMDSQEAMAVLGINRPMLDYWLTRGKIKHIDDGFAGKVWFAVREVNRVLEQRAGIDKY